MPRATHPTLPPQRPNETPTVLPRRRLLRHQMRLNCTQRLPPSPLRQRLQMALQKHRQQRARSKLATRRPPPHPRHRRLRPKIQLLRKNTSPPTSSPRAPHSGLRKRSLKSQRTSMELLLARHRPNAHTSPARRRRVRRPAVEHGSDSLHLLAGHQQRMSDVVMHGDR